MTEPTSDLVKRLETPETYHVQVSRDEFDEPYETKECQRPIDPIRQEAAARIRALEAEVGTWNANYNKQVYKNLTDMVALRADADRRVAEEQQRCIQIIASLGYENDEDGFASECIHAIRSRSNGAEPDTDNGVHANACAPAGVEKVTPPLSQWQPIETAPKDGTWVLLYWPMTRTNVVVSGHFYAARDGEEFWWSQPRVESSKEPTHWMPLPVPPAPGSDDFLGIPNVSVNKELSPTDTINDPTVGRE